MKLAKFKIRNYKRIEETGWVEVDDVTALVGGNETGKSSILQALWKLKPGRENVVLDPIDEFPRRRLTDDYQRGGEWPVVSALFVIDEETRKALKQLHPVFAECEQVICTNYYDTERTDIEFVPSVSFPVLTQEDLLRLVQRTKEQLLAADYDLSEVQVPPVPPGAEEGQQAEVTAQQMEVVEQFKSQLAAVVDETLAQSNGNVLMELKGFYDRVDALMAHDWQRRVWQEVAQPIADLLHQPNADEYIEEARKIVWDAVPIFVYFDDYNLLESQIYIPEAIRLIAARSTEPKVRSQWALFELAGFDIDEIASLAFQNNDPNEQLTQETRDIIFREAEKRSILASAAGRALTEKFIDWWHQHRHTIDFHVDGEVFQIEVEDERYPVPIRFEGRSQGFRWFFTFYLVFTAETDRQHRNAILLLDEPGLHLYKPAQEELLGFFDELSRSNQVIYSTHSPFMIDSTHLERVRLVEELNNGLVQISPDTQSVDDRVVFPVETAFLNQFAQLLFLSRRVLVVEGETDQRLLQYLSDLLVEQNRVGLPERTVVIAAKGNRSVHPLVALLIPHQFEVTILLDSDKAGRSAGERLEELGFIGEPLVNLCFYGDILGQDDPFDLESLLPPALYRQAVEETHDLTIPGGVKATKHDSLCVAIKKYLRNQGNNLDKGLPIEWLLKQWRAEPQLVPDSVLDQAETIFRSIHASVSDMEDESELGDATG